MHGIRISEYFNNYQDEKLFLLIVYLLMWKETNVKW